MKKRRSTQKPTEPEGISLIPIGILLFAVLVWRVLREFPRGEAQGQAVLVLAVILVLGALTFAIATWFARRRRKR